MRLTGGHAFILCAPPEEQAKLADTFAISAMRSQDEDVLLRIRTHNHPDVITVQPEGATIKIRQARALIEQLSNRAFEGKNRVVCLFTGRYHDPGSAELSAQNPGRTARKHDFRLILHTARLFIGNRALPLRTVAGNRANPV